MRNPINPMTPIHNGLTLSRRALLKGMSAAAGTVAASSVIPIRAHADLSTPGAIASPPFTPPPTSQAVASSASLYNSYQKALAAVPGQSQTPMPTTLYALDCVTRTDITLGDVTLNATAFKDAASPPAAGAVTVGPTMEFVRGQTTGVYLRNNMTVCGADYQIDMANPTSGWKPHGFTTTNLHTHGLHVSPQAPSDDVLIMLRSSANTNPAVTHLLTSYPYLYNVPGDHPVGTFWYHPHKHGAVAS